jgi:hypothetical protein
MIEILRKAFGLAWAFSSKSRRLNAVFDEQLCGWELPMLDRKRR